MVTETKTDLQVGNIVRVIHPGWRHDGKQGVVVEIVEDDNENGPIGVRFPSWYGYILDRSEPLDTIVRFQIDELVITKHFDEIPLHVYLTHLFKMRVWISIEQKIPLIPGDTDCMHEDCDRKAWFEAWCNNHGTAQKFCVCSKHAWYHGVCCDGFPGKK